MGTLACGKTARQMTAALAPPPSLLYRGDFPHLYLVAGADAGVVLVRPLVVEVGVDAVVQAVAIAGATWHA